MKLFSCQACGQLLYFENVQCVHCHRSLGYLPDIAQISALEPRGDGGWKPLAAPQKTYKFCNNNQFGVCNWMVAGDDQAGYCAACRHNHVIPDLTVPGNDLLWARLEGAKHRLFYTLMRLRLPLQSRIEDPLHGLAFDFLADSPQDHAARVLTGHDNGLITLALKEADDALREKVRNEMGEPYRTLLGHFRHESGHYFWDRLVATDNEALESFRSLFGDERADYAAALQAHYDHGALPDWQANFVSVYATTHPWEDFAETWAHYLHIVDALETASSFGVKIKPRAARGDLAARVDFDPHNAADMEQLIDAWLPIAFAVNSLNRSMGLSDLYPFVLTPGTIGKLAFVHALTHPQAAMRKASPSSLGRAPAPARTFARWRGR